MSTIHEDAESIARSIRTLVDLADSVKATAQALLDRIETACEGGGEDPDALLRQLAVEEVACVLRDVTSIFDTGELQTNGLWTCRRDMLDALGLAPGPVPA